MFLMLNIKRLGLIIFKQIIKSKQKKNNNKKKTALEFQKFLIIDISK